MRVAGMVILCLVLAAAPAGAAMDPATRNNAWTLAIADRVRFQKTEINSRGEEILVTRTKKRKHPLAPLEG